MANPIGGLNGNTNPDFERNQILLEIARAKTTQELQLLLQRCSSDIGFLKDYAKKQSALAEKAEEEVKELKNLVSTYIAPDGTLWNDTTLSEKIRERIPANTFQQVYVTTLKDPYQFVKSSLKVRKIELIRTAWTGFDHPFIEGFPAFFSSLFKSNSIYRKSISNNLILSGILASTEFPKDKETEFQTQLRSVYWKGQKIEIIVPIDLSDNGVITISTESAWIEGRINGGKWIRSLFTTD